MTADGLRLGFANDQAAQTSYGRYLAPTLGPLPGQAVEALLRGPRAPELFPKPTEGRRLQQQHTDQYDLLLKTGYALTPGGAMIIACQHAPMPEVTPAMWAWWFAWHGHDSARYKLWHPQAHVSVAWADGGGYTGEYVGRTSLVQEYIGGELTKLGIRFVAPRELGFDEQALLDAGEVVICARAVQRRGPMETQVGTFCHYVRPTAQGAVMQSYFWLGGEYVRRDGAQESNMLIRTIAKCMARRDRDAQALLVHNAEEMLHLGNFIAKLHADFAETADDVSQQGTCSKL